MLVNTTDENFYGFGNYQINILPLSPNHDLPAAGNKTVPKRLRGRRGNSRRKKNRGQNLPKNYNLENMSDQHHDQQRIDVPDEDKQKMRKKNRNVLCNKPLEISTAQTKVVKFYRPLSLYLQLKLEPAELYSKLKTYVLCMDDLNQNGFPIYSPGCPDNVTFSKSYKFGGSCEESADSTQRWCCRCGAKYHVSDDGLYEAESICSYHHGRRQYAGPYSCCGTYSPEGCSTSKHHVSSSTKVKSIQYVKTREKKNCSAEERAYALDCEMCYTLQGMEIARVSVVGIDGLTVYDSYVLPESPIVDYNTTYSGITAKDLNNITTTLADVQAFLLKLLCARTILIGHSLESDLKALRLVHETIVDTSVIFPHRFGYPYKRSLRSLVSTFLNKNIQQSEMGHDSVEDARACIELMLWKIESDKNAQQKCRPFKLPMVPLMDFSFFPNPAPCNVRYWVPPVGCSSDLF